MANIIFTGGGTAGHVFPGLAVAGLLRQTWPCTLYWIGTRWGMEHDIVASYGIPFISIPAGKLRRYLSLWNVADIFVFLGGVAYSLVYLMFKRPALLFSKGGFVSVPPTIAAKIQAAVGPAVTNHSARRLAVMVMAWASSRYKNGALGAITRLINTGCHSTEAITTTAGGRAIARAAKRPLGSNTTQRQLRPTKTSPKHVQRPLAIINGLLGANHSKSSRVAKIRPGESRGGTQ